MPDLEGLHPERASELIAGFLAGAPAGGWLPRGPTAELLGCYGVPLAPCTAVTTEGAAIAAAERCSGPIALRADVPGLMRMSDIGTVVPGLDGADEVRRGFRSLRETFGDRLAAVIIQPMITGGVEVAISVLQEQLFGPLVLFGLATGAGALADRTARLAPLTDADAEDLIRSVPGAPLLSGRRGTPAADLAALRDMLLRVSRMADDLPQIASSNSILSSPAPTAPRPSTAGSASRRPSPPTPTCAGCHNTPVSGARAPACGATATLCELVSGRGGAGRRPGNGPGDGQ